MTKLRLPQFTSEDLQKETPHNPNLWFAKMFPMAARNFGPAFLQRTYDDDHGLNRFVPEELNIDFFAAALGGDPLLGHRLVFYLPEEMFYFYEPRLKCFCPTSEEKLVALLSNYLIRCSQDSGFLVDIRPIFSDFRKTEVLSSIIKRARALLAAEQSFFQGEKGHRRLVDGRMIEPTAKPSYEVFVEKALMRQDRATLTVTEAFHVYYNFCKEHQMAPLTRHEFRAFVTEVIREEFQLGLRRDVPARNGGQCQGWWGIGVREQAPVGLN